MTEEKVRENRVRRMAERQGCRLAKSRRRDPLAFDYGGYMLVDVRTNTALLGSSPHAYSADIEDVEKFLQRDRDVFGVRERKAPRKRVAPRKRG